MSARGGHTQGVASASSDVAGASDARAEGFNELGPVALPRIGKEERFSPPCPRHRQAGRRAGPPQYLSKPFHCGCCVGTCELCDPTLYALPPPPPPEALEAAASSDRRAASRSRSPRAPRGRGPSQMWLDALYAAQRKFARENIQPRGKVRQCAKYVMKQWREDNHERKLMERKASKRYRWSARSDM